jgi:hypothetical protein
MDVGADGNFDYNLNIFLAIVERSYQANYSYAVISQQLIFRHDSRHFPRSS